MDDIRRECSSMRVSQNSHLIKIKNKTFSSVTLHFFFFF